jgi:hypothetical protein
MWYSTTFSELGPLGIGPAAYASYLLLIAKAVQDLANHVSADTRTLFLQLRDSETTRHSLDCLKNQLTLHASRAREPPHRIGEFAVRRQNRARLVAPPW